MAWYDEAVFYHIYPLGMTGAPKQNSYGEPVSRLKNYVNLHILTNLLSIHIMKIFMRYQML